LGEWKNRFIYFLPWHYLEVNGQLHATAALLPGKEPLVPLDRRLGGTRNLSGRGGEEKNFQLPPGIEP
jgi:hypothetical protein